MKARMLHWAEKAPAQTQEAIEAWQNEKRDWAEGVPGARQYPCGELQVGDIVDHPDCWINCCQGQMEPYDQECLDKVIGHFKRKGIPYDAEKQAELLAKYTAMTKMALTGNPKIDAPKPKEDEGEREEADEE